MRRTLAVLALLTALTLPAAPCRADDIAGVSSRHPGLVYTISPGLAGRARTGRWTPVRVLLSNPTERLQGSLELVHRLVDGTQSRHRLAVELPAGSTKQFTIYYVHSGNAGTELILHRDRGSPAFVHDLEVEAIGLLDTRVIAVIGERSFGVPLGFPVAPQEGEVLVPPRWVGMVVGLEQTPDRWLGWDAVDEILVARPPGDFPSRRHAQALADWTRAGGHLVLAIGDRWNEFRDSIFAPLLPGEPTASVEYDFARALPEAGLQAGEARGVRCVLREPAGRTVAGTSAAPLAIRHPAGVGRVTFVAFDPGRPPFLRATALEKLWESRIFLLPAKDAPRDDPRYYGYSSDPIAQIMEGAPLGHRIGSGWMILALMAYFVVLGLLDYFVLRLLKKFDWMWASMGVWVFLFTALCWVLSEYGRERATIDRTVRVIDVGADGSRSGRSMVCLYSPVAATFDLVGAGPGFAVRHHENRDRWARNAGGALLGDIRGVLLEDDTLTLAGLRLHRGMMTTLQTDWYDPPAEAPAAIDADADGNLVRIRNASALPFTAVVVASQEKYWQLPSLAPGEETRVDLAAVPGTDVQLGAPVRGAEWWQVQSLAQVVHYSTLECIRAAALRNKQQYYHQPGSEVIRDLSPLLRDGGLAVFAGIDDATREMAIRGAACKTESATVLRFVISR